jgi:hypothetical protein
MIGALPLRNLLKSPAAAFDGRATMSSAPNKDHYAWRSSYTAALFEDDATKVAALIALAESQIIARARMLFDPQGENGREMSELDNALHMLHILKSCVKVGRPLEKAPEVHTSQSPVLQSAILES